MSFFGAGMNTGGVDWLLFGLGNPGRKYDGTRHNLGWMLIDLLAARHKARLSPGRADYIAGRFRLGEDTIHLIKPTTWMNLSGRAIRQYLSIEKPENWKPIVAIDDVNVDLGRLRFRPRGSAGGHNGLKSVEQHLGNKDYARIRLGCGPGPAGDDLADFVLERFARDEEEAVAVMLERAADAVESWVQSGPEETMGRFNG